jgi:hypothetical protein
VWGAGWFIAALVAFGTLRLVGFFTVSWEDVFINAVRAGIVGGVAGVVFSTVIRVLYHGRRLSEISWIRFGIGGGIVAAVCVPLFLQMMNLLSGDGLVAWALVLDDVPLAAVFGGSAAGVTLKLAQHVEASLPGGAQDALDSPEDLERLP